MENLRQVPPLVVLPATNFQAKVIMPRLRKLTDRHYLMLATIQKLQPTSMNIVARQIGLKPGYAHLIITGLFTAHGLVEQDISRFTNKYGIPIRQAGTLRLTKEGEEVLRIAEQL